MAIHVSTTRAARPAAAAGLPIRLISAEPMPGLVSCQIGDTRNHTEAAEQARAMNAVLVALTAILSAEGGAHV